MSNATIMYYNGHTKWKSYRYVQLSVIADYGVPQVVQIGHSDHRNVTSKCLYSVWNFIK